MLLHRCLLYIEAPNRIPSPLPSGFSTQINNDGGKGLSTTLTGSAANLVEFACYTRQLVVCASDGYLRSVDDCTAACAGMFTGAQRTDCESGCADFYGRLAA